MVSHAANKDLMDYTLRELQGNPNAKVIQEKGKTTIQLRTPEATIRANIHKYPLSEERSMSITPCRNSRNKDDFEKEVLQRLDEGYTQNDVALTMGISQSRVSQIKTKHKK